MMLLFTIVRASLNECRLHAMSQDGRGEYDSDDSRQQPCRADDEFSGQRQVNSADSGHCEKSLPARVLLVYVGVSVSHGID
jgi:hypothetical protein